jgi:hypothetical protein
VGKEPSLPADYAVAFYNRVDWEIGLDEKGAVEMVETHREEWRAPLATTTNSG